MRKKQIHKTPSFFCLSSMDDAELKRENITRSFRIFPTNLDQMSIHRKRREIASAKVQTIHS